jgi:peptidoglycan hydrolase CwlO-like protein
MDPIRPAGGRRRPAALALGLAVALAASLAVPALAVPGQPGPTTLAGARAEAARLQREVARLDLRVEDLAEAHAATQARLESLIQAAHRHQAALERSELALQATRAEYAGDVRGLYARGPLAPLELLLAAGDIHELAVAMGVAGGVLDQDLRALSSVGLATGTVRARVAELGTTQAETLALRERQASHEEDIAHLLATRKAMLATARAEVRAQIRAEQAREEAARLAMVADAAARARALGFTALADRPAHNRVAPPSARWASPTGGGRPGRTRSTARGWSASPTPTPGGRCRGLRASSGRPAAMSRCPTCAPGTWSSTPTTRPTRPPSTTSACTSARA